MIVHTHLNFQRPGTTIRNWFTSAAAQFSTLIWPGQLISTYNWACKSWPTKHARN